jgi:hypothetical protein
MQKQINPTPITQLIQQIRAAELARQAEVKIPIQQARLLSLTLVEILESVNKDWESLYHALKQAADPEVIKVELDGGGFGQPK